MKDLKDELIEKQRSLLKEILDNVEADAISLHPNMVKDIRRVLKVKIGSERTKPLDAIQQINESTRILALVNDVTESDITTAIKNYIDGKSEKPIRTAEEIKEIEIHLRRILSEWYRRDDYSTEHAIDDIFNQFKQVETKEEPKDK